MGAPETPPPYIYSQIRGGGQNRRPHAHGGFRGGGMTTAPTTSTARGGSGRGTTPIRRNNPGGRTAADLKRVAPCPSVGGHPGYSDGPGGNLAKHCRPILSIRPSTRLFVFLFTKFEKSHPTPKINKTIPPHFLLKHDSSMVLHHMGTGHQGSHPLRTLPKVLRPMSFSW